MDGFLTKSGLSVSEGADALLGLELKGLVVRLPGEMFIRKER
jgi:predicted Rossmann fold nucleotide-binding protein DprA/Smf involved in DNA uptake